MKRNSFRGGLILQVAILFALGVLVTGFLTYFTEHELSGQSVRHQTELYASQISDEVGRSVMEYPAFEWMIRYWYDHADTMDINYDEEFTPDSVTAEKSRLLEERHPELSLVYATAEELEALPEEDQKLYAEITYSWLITRLNQIKQANHVDYLFCVVTEEPFDSQFFLFSGADPGAVRGTNYEEVYPLGHVVSVSGSQQDAMRSAHENRSHLADAGKYMDFYSNLCEFDGHAVLIGMTYSLTDLREHMSNLTRTGTIFAVLNQIGLSLICLTLSFVFVLHPLKAVQENIRIYRDRKDSREVVKNLALVRPHNEIGQLSQDVAELTVEIDDYMRKIETITAERQRVKTELHMAMQIQRAMLPGVFPPFPDRREFDIYACMAPAREVGGDFYDFFLIDSDHLCLVMADVSGKGIPAALFMMVSKIILANNAKMGKSPAQVLTDTNTTICSNNPQEMFVTVWMGILELSTGKLVASSAGHEYPVWKQPGEPFRLLKDKHGLVVGAMEGIRYKDYELQLSPGAKLFLYTDGVPEATDAENCLFGAERMLRALNANADSNAGSILRQVRSAVDDFVQEAEQFDDLTMMCVEYFGPTADGEKENG